MKSVIFLVLFLCASLKAQYSSYTKYSRYANYSAGQSLTLEDIGTVRADWNADLGITLSGSDVTNWADQSGNGYNLRSIAPRYPVYVTNEQNGHNGVTFDASNLERLYSLTGIGYVGNPQFTLAAVAKGTNGGRIFHIGDSSGAAGQVIIASFEDESTPPDPSARWNNGNMRWQNSSDVTTYSILVWKFAGATYAETELWQNGTEQTFTASVNSGNSASITNEEIRIGWGRNTSASNTAFYSGTVLRIIVIDGFLSDSKTADLFTLLNNEYVIY